MKYLTFQSRAFILLCGVFLSSDAQLTDNRHLLDKQTDGKRFADAEYKKVISSPLTVNAVGGTIRPPSDANLPATTTIYEPEREKKSKSGKKNTLKGSKSSKGSKKMSGSSSSKGGKKDGGSSSKGGSGGKKTSKSSKGGGGNPNPPPDCTNPVANTLSASVQGINVIYPSRCCDFDGPTAVFITHSEENSNTDTGLEIFWDSMYQDVDMISSAVRTCFVFTAVQDDTTRTVKEITIDAIAASNMIDNVPAIMATDPTDDIQVVQAVRNIIKQSNGANIGVWNAGFANIFVESIFTGQPLIPFIGYKSDEEYGTSAANAVMQLLPDGVAAAPLCLNGRPELAFIGERCDRYYFELGEPVSGTTTGVACSTASTEQDILELIVANGTRSANAVVAHVDCCTAAVSAAETAREQGLDVVVGCMDEDTTGGDVSFVTLQSVGLQAYGAVTWVTQPLVEASTGDTNGRDQQFFPGLDSHLDTDIYNEVSL